MKWKRYKVIEKPGGLGEVVQITVRDIGTNSGENTPLLHVTSLRRRAEGGASVTPSHVGGHAGPCASCAYYQDRLAVLESHVRHVEKQMYANNLLNTLMCSLDSRHDERERAVNHNPGGQQKQQQQQQPEEEEEEEDGGKRHSTLLEMMKDEIGRQNLLQALINLVERPTSDEVAHRIDRFLSSDVKALRRAIPKE